VHECNLVHRDLKPANVLLDLDGPKVIDFGISRALQNIFTTIGRQEPIGTPAYMSPEQAECKPVGPASDVFSLGSVIAFAATGKVLFGAALPVTEMYRVINDQPDLTSIGEPLRGLLSACLAKIPADRPSLDELLDAIVAASTAFSDASPSSFWPRQLAEYIRTRNDVTDPRRSMNEPQILAEPLESPVLIQAYEVPQAGGEEAQPTGQETVAPLAQAAAPAEDVVTPGLDESAEPATPPPGIAEVTADHDDGSGGTAVPTDLASESKADLQAGLAGTAASSAASRLATLEPTRFMADPSVNGAISHDEQHARSSRQQAGGRAWPILPLSSRSGSAESVIDSSSRDDPGQLADPHGTSADDGTDVDQTVRSPRRRLFAVSAGVVTAGIVAALSYAVWPGQLAVSQHKTASYDTRAVHYSDGLEVRTTWTISGVDGSSLTEKIAASNTKPGSLSVQFREPVPVAILTRMGGARFTPSGPMIIDHGRGLVWSFHLRAGGRAVVSYQVGIAGIGVSQGRLRRLVGKVTPFQKDRSPLSHPPSPCSP
jgi:hypothetical protein